MKKSNIIHRKLTIPCKDFNEFYKYLFDETLTGRFEKPLEKNGDSYECQISYSSVDATLIDKYLNSKKVEHLKTENKNPSYINRFFIKLVERLNRKR